MKRFAGALACLLALFFVFGAGGELTEEQSAAADAYFSRQFENANPVGGAVLVSRAGQRIYSFYYGVGAKRDGRPVDEDTVFKVASVTKMVTAIGVMQLAEAGKLDLDAPLTGVSGQPIRNPWHPEGNVTLRQALSHTTSLLGDAPYATAPRWERIDLSDTKFFSKRAPGTRYEYSNLNGGILGSAIERASGQSLNAYMTEHVFAPLRINGAYAAHLLPDPAPLSNTFMPDRGVFMSAAKYMEADARDYDDTCDPDKHYNISVGSLYISLEGLEKLAQVLACDGKAGDVRLLSARAVALMRADQKELPGSSVTGSSPYGLGLYRFTGEDGTAWYGHQGRWQGMQADVFVEPQTQTTLVMVMNGVSRTGSGEVDKKAIRAMGHVAGWLAEMEPLEDSFVVVDEE